MATKIVYERAKDKKQSTAHLEDYLKYLGNTTHKDHLGKTLLPGRNYNCGPTEKDFVEAVQATQDNYVMVRQAQGNGSGKRTADIWEEAIHNLGVGCYLTEAERNAIEKEHINRICPNSPARATWHIDEETGQADLHIVFATKNYEGTLTLARTEIHLFRRQKELDRWSADLINRNEKKIKKRNQRIKTAAEAAREKTKAKAKKKPLSLAHQLEKLARKEGIKEVDEEHLPGLLERLGLIIKKIVAGTIHVAFSRTKRCGKIRIPKTGIINVDAMIDKILEIQIERKLNRDKQLEKEL